MTQIRKFFVALVALFLVSSVAFAGTIPRLNSGDIMEDGREVFHAWYSEQYVLGNMYKAMSGSQMVYDGAGICAAYSQCLDTNPLGCVIKTGGSSDKNFYENRDEDTALNGGLSVSRNSQIQSAIISVCPFAEIDSTWNLSRLDDGERYSWAVVVPNLPAQRLDLGPACSDGVDNDADSKVDDKDPGCHWDGDVDNVQSYNPKDDNESDFQWDFMIDTIVDNLNNPCPVHIEGNANTGIMTVTDQYCECLTLEAIRGTCGDGIDNDDDGDIDWPKDKDCDDAKDNEDGTTNRFEIRSIDAVQALIMKDDKAKAKPDFEWAPLIRWVGKHSTTLTIQVDESDKPITSVDGLGADVWYSEDGSYVSITFPDRCKADEEAKQTEVEQVHAKAYTGFHMFMTGGAYFGATLPPASNIYGLPARGYGDGMIEFGLTYSKKAGISFLIALRGGGGADGNCFTLGHGLVGARIGGLFNRHRTFGFGVAGTFDAAFAPWMITEKVNDQLVARKVTGRAFLAPGLELYGHIAFGRGDRNGFVDLGVMGQIRDTFADPVGGDVSAVEVLLPGVGGVLRVGKSF